MKCETCRWHGDGKPHGIPNDGACHYQPPFPRVRPEDWCSHWESQEEGTITTNGWTIKWERDGTTVKMSTKGWTSMSDTIRKGCEETLSDNGIKICMTCQYMMPDPSRRLGQICAIWKKRVSERGWCNSWELVTNIKDSALHRNKIGQEIWL